MGKKFRLTITLILLAVIIPMTANAKRSEESSGEIPMSFKKTATLPGNIEVEFYIVTLNKYKNAADKVFEYTFEETTRIANLFNTNNAESELARVAAAAGTKQPVVVSKELLVIAEHAKEVAGWTAGIFDPVNGAEYKTLKINKGNSTLYLKKPGTSLELRGILEGFLADLFIRAAYHASVDDSFVRVGGVVRAMGEDAYNPWRIIIEGVGDKKAKKGMALTLKNYSAATVGPPYGAPTINPKSGAPVETPFYSMTVLAAQAATAQAVATATYIAGEVEGENLINALGIRAIFAYNDGRFKKVGRW